MRRRLQPRYALGKSGGPDFLMLNAGVGTKGTWGDSDYFRR